MVHRYNLGIPIDSFAHGYPGQRGLEVQFLDRGIFFLAYRWISLKNEPIFRDPAQILKMILVL